MSEFFREVNEDYRRDQVMAFFKRFGLFLMFILALGLVSLVGWNYKTHLSQKAAEVSGDVYEKAWNLTSERKNADAEKLLQEVLQTAPNGYQTLARFRIASEQAEMDPSKGAQSYLAITDDKNVPAVLQDLARLRAAYTLFDKSEASVWQPQLERLDVASNPWRHQARELLGLSAYKAGNISEAEKRFDAMLGDRETPQALRERIQIYMGLLLAGPVTQTSPIVSIPVLPSSGPSNPALSSPVMTNPVLSLPKP